MAVRVVSYLAEVLETLEGARYTQKAQAVPNTHPDPPVKKILYVPSGTPLTVYFLPLRT